MTFATLDHPVAILYSGNTATWCQGGCSRFRYPYCHVGDRPYCEGCALIARIKAIPALPAPPAPPKVKIAKERRPQSNRKRRDSSNIDQEILEALADEPCNTTTLIQKTGWSHKTILRHTLALEKDRKILSFRHVGGTGGSSARWYSLVKDKSLLVRRVVQYR